MLIFLYEILKYVYTVSTTKHDNYVPESTVQDEFRAWRSQVSIGKKELGSMIPTTSYTSYIPNTDSLKIKYT